MSAVPLAHGRESALAAIWVAGARGPLRLEDGRSLAVAFPGIPGGASGPDFRDAILDAGGDLLRGDVELHLRASGWRSHGHHRDPAYGGVVLHVVAENDSGAQATLHDGARAVPILVLQAPAEAFPPPFTPPCAFASAAGREPASALLRLGERRLRMKAARLAPAIAADGPGQALYAALLETLGGSANRAAFAAAARTLPLAALLAAADERTSSPRPLTITALVAAHAHPLCRSGLRPAASPERRLAAAGTLLARLWPAGAGPGWPAILVLPCPPRLLMAPGQAGRALAVELIVNAILPVALAAGAWEGSAVMAAYTALPTPGTYGRLKPLEGWLGAAARPFPGAATLQGGLLLHADYCSRGRCGRCPLS